MKFEYQISEADTVSALKLFSKPTRGSVLWTLAIIGTFIIFYFWLAGASAAMGALAGSLILGPALWFAHGRIYLPYHGRQQYRSYDALRATTTVRIDEVGVRFFSAHGEHIVFWENVRNWRANKMVAIIYVANRQFHIVPLSDPAFSDVLCDSLADKIGPQLGR